MASRYRRASARGVAAHSRRHARPLASGLAAVALVRRGRDLDGGLVSRVLERRRHRRRHAAADRRVLRADAAPDGRADRVAGEGMKVVILAGGLGTRLAEERVTIPKPMVLIGQHPILWHIMKFYASYGLEEFVLALGYKAEVVKNFFLQFADMASDLTVDLGAGTVERRRRHEETWKIHLINTGLDTLTGGRVRRLAPLIRDETFMLTWRRRLQRTARSPV